MAKIVTVKRPPIVDGARGEGTSVDGLLAVYGTTKRFHRRAYIGRAVSTSTRAFGERFRPNRTVPTPSWTGRGGVLGRVKIELCRENFGDYGRNRSWRECLTVKTIPRGSDKRTEITLRVVRKEPRCSCYSGKIVAFIYLGPAT